MSLYRCGVLVPWVNTAVEEDLRNLPRRIAYHIARLVPDRKPSNPHDENYLSDILDKSLHLDSHYGWLRHNEYYLACTSATFTPRLYSVCGHPIITAYGCILEELRSRSIREVQIVTPYSPTLHQSLCAALQCDGVYVTNSLSLEYNAELRDLTPSEVVSQCVKARVLKDRTPILVICTAFVSRKLIALMDRMGAICITSNSALLNKIRRSADLASNGASK